jgi:FHA domain-containing protein/zinc ribbon protein
MRECQQCGEANQPSSRFCVVCGTPLVSAAPGALSPPPGAASLARPPAISVAPPPAQQALAAHGTPGAVAGAAGGTNRPSPPLAATGGRDLAVDFALDGPRTLVGFLVSFENVPLGQYWPIHQGRNVVGRQGAATGLDIEVSHPTTSSLHAVLLASATPGRVVVEDTSSTNGTFVNDNALAPGQRWELRDGDRVRFGLFNATIKIVQRT